MGQEQSVGLAHLNPYDMPRFSPPDRETVSPRYYAVLRALGT